MTNDLQKTNVVDLIDTQLSAEQTTDLGTTFARVYTGSDQTAQTPSKIGDIFVKDDGAIYVAKSLTPASGWVALDVTGA